eukprot:1768048-Rhodomonas_salina.1
MRRRQGRAPTKGDAPRVAGAWNPITDNSAIRRSFDGARRRRALTARCCSMRRLIFPRSTARTCSRSKIRLILSRLARITFGWHRNSGGVAGQAKALYSTHCTFRVVRTLQTDYSPGGVLELARRTRSARCRAVAIFELARRTRSTSRAPKPRTADTENMVLCRRHPHRTRYTTCPSDMALNFCESA